MDTDTFFRAAAMAAVAPLTPQPTTATSVELFSKFSRLPTNRRVFSLSDGPFFGEFYAAFSLHLSRNAN
jgi:hypothetical protein